MGKFYENNEWERLFRISCVKAGVGYDIEPALDGNIEELTNYYTLIVKQFNDDMIAWVLSDRSGIDWLPVFERVVKTERDDRLVERILLEDL